MTSEKDDSQNEENENSTDGSGTVSREEWFEMLNAANPLDSYLKSKKEFEKTEPPIEAIKFYRQERTYYLLNRGEEAIDRLIYRAAHRDVNTKQNKATGRYEVTEVPPRSYVEIGEMDLEAGTRMQVELERVEWEGGDVAQAPRRLKLFQPSVKAVLPLNKLDLRPAETDPSAIGFGDA